MIEKLKSVEEKFESINTQLCDPDVVSDIEKYKTLMQEAKHLTPVVEKYREYKKVNADFEEAQAFSAREDSIKNSVRWFRSSLSNQETIWRKSRKS